MTKTITAATARSQITVLNRKERRLVEQLAQTRTQRAALQAIVYDGPASVVKMAAAFDKLGIPVESPKRIALPRARKSGLHASNAIMEAALKYRRQLADIPF